MQISMTAEIPENEMRRKLSENTKNPKITKEQLDTDLGDQTETQRHDWGTRVHATGRMCEWMILIMNKTEWMMKNNTCTEI